MNGASGVGYVCGVNVHALIPCPVVQLGIGLIVLLSLYKPPLYLRDGVSYHLTMQLCIIVCKPELGQGRLDEAGWVRLTNRPNEEKRKKKKNEVILWLCSSDEW